MKKFKLKKAQFDIVAGLTFFKCTCVAFTIGTITFLLKFLLKLYNKIKALANEFEYVTNNNQYVIFLTMKSLIKLCLL